VDLLDKMATYVRVVEAGSFSAAAKQLRISTGAVSRQIATLERELHAPLLLRSTRRMNITALGQIYYERSLKILRELDEVQALGRSSRVDGLLKISAPVPFGIACVVPAIPGLLARNPNLRLDLRLEDRLIDLALEGIDIAIRVGNLPADSTEIIAHRLFGFRRILLASPQYLKQHGEPRSPEALSQHRALVYAPDLDSWALEHATERKRVQVDVLFRSNAVHAVRELALQGAGIALLPEWFAIEALQRRELQRVLPDWQSAAVSVHALHRKRQRGEARTRSVIEHLRSVLAENRSY
jgi:DNA-binding transcriptional LysR family regulator